MSVHQGCFITFEGPEGSGKSSQVKRLAAALRRAGYRVTTLADPGSTALGRRLRQVLLHADLASISPMAEALLFIAGRIQLVEERIVPALRRGEIVICDRFHDSTMAYQAFAERLDVAALDRLGRDAIGHLMPTLTIMLDVQTSVGFKRLNRRKDRMERKIRAFHERVRRGYLQIARREPRRCVVIDGTQNSETVTTEILQVASTRLHLRTRG